MTSLEVVSVTDQILVDGVMVEIKIIEEWGFNIGEDACLFEEDLKSILSCPDNVQLHDDLETNNNVEVLVDKIVKDLVEAEDQDLNVINDDRGEMVNLEITVPVEEHAIDVSRLGCPDSLDTANQTVCPLSNAADSLVKDGLDNAAEDALSI
jgi:hypothetical protein